MPGIIATEIMALAWRHWLLDRLSGRSDILGTAPIPPVLAKRVGRFLVAGLDYAGDPGAEGWPVPTGGRYSKLCFSPALTHANTGIKGLHVLPVKLDDYLRYVESTCGIGPEQADNLFRLFRLTPEWLFDACAGLRARSPEAWCLLLSHEFRLAWQLFPDLRREIDGSTFRRPLIHGFMIIAELERAYLIMRHLGRAQAIANRPELLDVLSGPLPLSSWYGPAQLAELQRWLEYTSFSSTVLRNLLFDQRPEDIVRLPKAFGPWAAATGEPIGHAETFVDDYQVRAMLIDALTPPPAPPPDATSAGGKNSRDDSSEPPVERKKPLLRNEELWRWYGLTNRVLPLVALDGIRDLVPTKNVAGAKRFRPSARKGPARDFLAELASAMRVGADPAIQNIVSGASSRYIASSRKNLTKTLEGNSRQGLKWARLYLPTRPRDGSGARFDHLMWLTPERDAAFWRTLLDLRRGGRLSRYRTPTARNLRGLAGIMRRAYEGLFRDASWSDRKARIVCDLAAAIGPISGNPDIAYAMHVLSLKPRIQRRLGVTNRGGFGNGAKARSAGAKITTT